MLLWKKLLIAANAILHSLVQDKILPKRVPVYNHTRNAMKQILSNTLENWPGFLLLGWPEEEQRCCIWPFQPHTFPTSLCALSSPQLLLLLLLWRSLLNTENNHELHFAPKIPPRCIFWRVSSKRSLCGSLLTPLSTVCSIVFNIQIYLANY